MCGIFGHSYQRKAKIPAGQREILISSLCVANSYRGAQSWGVYAAGQKGKKARVRKEVGDIAYVAHLGALAAWPVVFGHTRHATTGAITVANQHPFRVRDVLLAHNGMIFNHEELNRKHGRKCEVDSMHFAHHLADGLTFSEIEAYGSLEWVEDKTPTKVYLCRMKGGVLSVAGIKNRRGKQVGTAWSSDRDHLRKSLEASRLTWFWYDDLKEGIVYEVSAGVMYVSRRPALELSAVQVDRRTWRTAQRRTSGLDDHESWWDRHYPRRGTRTYTWDSRTGSVVDTGTNYLDRDDTSLVGASNLTDREKALFSAASQSRNVSYLSDEGAGAKGRDAEESEEDYDAEAQRLGLIKLDKGMWSDPRSGKLIDQDDIDDLLDAEEDDAMQGEFRNLTESESVIEPLMTKDERLAYLKGRAVIALGNVKTGTDPEGKE